MSKVEIAREALAIPKIRVKKIEYPENFSKTIKRNEGIAKRHPKTRNHDQAFIMMVRTKL